MIDAKHARRVLRRLRDRADMDYKLSSDTIDTRIAEAIVNVYEGVAEAFGIELGTPDTWGRYEDES